MTRTVVVIPARYHASRLPGKPVALLMGVPIVVWVAKQAAKAKHINDVFIATDDRRIFTAAQEHQIHAVYTSAHHASGTDRVAEAVHTMNADFVINVQGDEPFIHPRDIEQIAEQLFTQSCDMVTLRTPILTQEEFLNPHCVKVVCDNQQHALYFSRAPIPYPRTEPHEHTGAYRHIGVYGFTARALALMTHAPPHVLEQCEGLEQLRALAMGLKIAVLEAHHVSRGIDTPEDLMRAQALVEQLGIHAFPT